MDQLEIKGKIKTAQINQALGFFILFFGVIVSFAMIYSNTPVQKMTSLIAGITLVIIGGGMMLFARKNLQKLHKLTK
jgi:cytochrome c biogenesis protein CcdA